MLIQSSSSSPVNNMMLFSNGNIVDSFFKKTSDIMCSENKELLVSARKA